VDYSFFNNKVNGYFNYYVNTTNGLLTDITLPPSAGFATYKANLGIVQNVGFDFNLRYMVYNNRAKQNSLSINVALAHNTNTLKQISSALEAFNSTQATTSSNRPKTLFKEGQSMNAIYGVPSLGIDPATGREVYRKQDGSVTTTWSADDLTVVGNSLPKYNMNFGFTVYQSGFMFSALFNYYFGGQVYNQTLVDKVENANIYTNVDIRVLTQRWTKPGDISFFKNIADQSQTQATSRFVENDRTLTCGSLKLDYQLDRLKAIKKMGLTRFWVGFQANNPFVISSVQQERGTSFPFARDITFNLRANF